MKVYRSSQYPNSFEVPEKDVRNKDRNQGGKKTWNCYRNPLVVASITSCVALGVFAVTYHPDAVRAFAGQAMMVAKGIDKFFRHTTCILHADDPLLSYLYDCEALQVDIW